jgi:hypothetical protein
MVMEQNEFKKRLSEVAEWTQEIKGPNGYAKGQRNIKYKGEWIEDDDSNEYDEYEIVDVDALNVPVEIKKLKPITSICEDCGVVVENRRKHFKKTQNRFGTQWRESCYTCKKHKNPNTDKFDMTATEAVAVWKEYLIKNSQK